jgi:hyperosmotically inducible periplasmic protein
MWIKSLKLAVISGFLMTSGFIYQVPGQNKPQMKKPETRAGKSRSASQSALVKEIRHELITLPYYDVFDWLEGEARLDGTVVLRGQVVRATTKSEAEARVKNIEGVSKVVNEIEVLPLSSSDDQLRIAIYRAIFNWDSPLFRYATHAVPPIHIIVKNGRATLKGVVASQSDSQLAYTAARGVPGLFEVNNQLQVEGSR